MSQALWIRNGLVFTGGDTPAVFHGGVLCQGATVAAVGPDTALAPAAAAAGADTIDAGGRLIGPGFINAHMHLYSTLARGMPLPGPAPTTFTEILERLWWRLDRALLLEDLGPSAEVALLEGLRAGVTCVIDHHASYGAIDGSLDALARAAARMGVRLSTCFEASDRNGPEALRAAIAENLRFGRATRGDPLVRGMFGLHASFTLSDDSLDRCAQAARDGLLPVHVHVAEAASDRADARARGFAGPLARLHARGLIGEGALAVHCVHTDEAEWALLRDARAFAVHNPQSNLNNAVGAAPVREMIARGVAVGLGTDGMEADVREELRAAFLLGHHQAQDPGAMWGEAASLLSTNRAIATGLFGLPLGELAPGAGADVAVFDYHPPTALEPANLLGHLLFGFCRAPAHAVVVAGRPRLRGGAFVDLDPAEVAARARERAARLWARF